MTKLKSAFKLTSKGTFIFAALVFVIIASIQLSKIGLSETMVGINTRSNDDVRYLHSAKTLIETGMLTYFNPDLPTVFIMPGLPILLAPFVALGGLEGGVAGFKIFQLLLQIAGIYLIGLIAERSFGARISKIAMLLTALYFPWAININYLYTELITTFLLLLMLLLSLVAFERESGKAHSSSSAQAARRAQKNSVQDAPASKPTAPALSKDTMILYAIIGALWALSVLVRPNMALLPIVMLIMFVIQKYKWVDIGKIVGIVALVFVVMMSPWWIRNCITFNRFIPLTLSSGDPMYAGTFLHDTPYAEKDEKILAMESERALLFTAACMDEIGFDASQKARAAENMQQQFGEDFWSALKWYTWDKVIAMWSVPAVFSTRWIDRVITNNNSYNFHVTTHRIYVWLAVIGIVLVPFLKKRIKPLAQTFLLMVLLYFIITTLPFFASCRYVLPVVPIATIFAASTIDTLLGLFSKS